MAVLPSAFLHLVLVECWPIPLAGFLFNKLINDSMTKVTMRMHGVSLAPISSWYQSKMTWGHVEQVEVSFNKGRPLHLPAYTFETLRGTDKVWLVTAWIFYLMAFALELCVIVQFFRRGLFFRSFNDGAYIHFAWHCHREVWYRRFVYGMMAVAVALPAIWLMQNVYYRLDEGPKRFWSNMEAFAAEWYTGIGLLFSLMKLGAFRVRFADLLRGAISEAPKYWQVRNASDSVQKYMLRLQVPEGFFESAESLGAKLVDALWCAQNGDITKLQQCLANPDDAAALLQECQYAQKEEGEKRIKDGKGT